MSVAVHGVVPAVFGFSAVDAAFGGCAHGEAVARSGLQRRRVRGEHGAAFGGTESEYRLLAQSSIAVVSIEAVIRAFVLELGRACCVATACKVAANAAAV